MWEDIIEIRAHSMRNNIISYGVPEEKDEETIQVVKKFIQTNLISILQT